VRTCQTPARAGLVVSRHPAIGNPPMPVTAQADITKAPAAHPVTVRREQADLVVIGAGESGSAAADTARAAGRHVAVLDARDGNEVVAIYAGPTVIVRRPETMVHIHCHDVIVATGAAEIHPVCPGSGLPGIVTARAAEELHAAGVNFGRAVTIGQMPIGVPAAPVSGRIVRFEGDTHVTAMVTVDEAGIETTTACDTAIVGLGFAPRDLLSRMAPTDSVATVGQAAQKFPLPPCPTVGTVCPCARVEVEDLEGVWARGFNELELVKRASLCGTGTCQGGVCGPHLQAFVAAKSGTVPGLFTARPASRQITLGEAAADTYTDFFRRTPLHDEHLALGAQMDRFGNWWRPWNYGDVVGEYWAVREAVSLGDVSTLGKMIVSGPDAVALLERLYPTTVADIKPGRSRYVLLLNERGHLIDDGMICRETETRFVLTFTSGGAGFAEMWIRDWAETWALDVRILDRTASLAAINVTGPLASELLQRVGLEEPPKFLQHRHTEVAGVPCHVMRLSFTGEASWELHHPVDQSVGLWRTLMEAGQDLGIKPHGLQTLFGLRLEKGHVIIGMDTELDTTPRRVGMDWAVKMDKPFFLGQAALARTAELPDHRRLFGFTIEGNAPMEGSPIWSEGKVVGHVASSFTSPLFGHGVMLGWLKHTPWPTTVQIDGRDATVTDVPFYDPEGRRARA
jgi:glycine cleavage system aminomethyltransferase T